MLAGQGLVAIWNDVTPDSRDNFHAWHMQEHMAERVAIPGFLRGRRLIAADTDTHPEFFTLYELDSPQVAQGADYAARLNAPTPWTARSITTFRNTARALARVIESHGPGLGGAMLTLRFTAPDPSALLAPLRATLAMPRIAGAHLCTTDTDASLIQTAEMRARTANAPPPASFILIEATDPEALATILPDPTLAAHGATQIQRGTYRLEFIRTKTA